MSKESTKKSITIFWGVLCEKLLYYLIIIVRAIWNFFFNYIFDSLYCYISLIIRNEEEIKNIETLLQKIKLPISLIESNGEINTSDNLFGAISLAKIDIMKEDNFSIKEERNEQRSSFLSSTDMNNNAKFLVNKASYKNSVNTIKSQTKFSKSLIIKQKIYSLNMKESSIKLSRVFDKKFRDIINFTNDDEERAKLIDAIFEENGFYFPLKIYFGGLIKKSTEKESSKKDEKISDGTDINVKVDPNKEVKQLVSIIKDLKDEKKEEKKEKEEKQQSNNSNDDSGKNNQKDGKSKAKNAGKYKKKEGNNSNDEFEDLEEVIKKEEEEKKNKNKSVENKDDNNNLNVNIDINNKEIDKAKYDKYKEITKVLGGDREKIKDNSYGEWVKSITIDNCQIIEYGNLQKITNIISNDIKFILRRPLEIVELKYERRKAYCEFMESLKTIYPEQLKGKENIKREMSNIKGIPTKIQSFPIKQDYSTGKWLFGSTIKQTKNVCVDSQIVGFELKFKEGKDCEFLIEYFPTKGNNLKCSVKANAGYPIDGSLDIKYIDEQELNKLY